MSVIPVAFHKAMPHAKTDYWDSYWIAKGLLKSQLYDVVNSTLQNFMDQIQEFGFIPNGGRIYCE